MKIIKEKNNLIISFDYNPVLVEIVKSLYNRKYLAKTKEWSVPIIHVKSVVETLTPYGFNSSDEVLEAYETEIKKQKNIERIKKSNFKDSENILFEELKLPLFNYQKIGIGFLCTTKSSLLADEPGLGKTIQSLSASRINQSILKNKHFKILIICPSTLKLNWEEEIMKWYDNEKITVITGSKKQRDKLWNNESNYYIMNYELLLKDINIIRSIHWNHLISDESTRISNSKSKTSKLIKTIKADYRTAMTGTPFNNELQDIWNIIDFCQPNALGTFWEFTNKYCLKDEFKNIVGYKNTEQLSNYLERFMIRRKKEEVLEELPPKLYENIYIEFSDEEKIIYNAIKEDIRQELSEYKIDRVLNDGVHLNVLTRMIRLKQATDSMQLISENNVSSKLNALKELLKDLIHTDEKVLIFTQFAEMAYILIEELKEYKPLLIAGIVKENERKENRQNFQNNEENKILISTDAGGVGLNLFRAKYVIHYDLPWSISKRTQREDRAHRIGQKNKVTVFNMIVENSIDEYILKVLFKKQKMSDEITKDNKKTSKIKMSKKDIENILM